MRRLLTTLLLLAAGCHDVHLTVNDTFAMGDKPTMLEAHVERHVSPTRTAPVAGVPVHFFMHEQKLGDAVTDVMGTARLMAPLPMGTTHYRAETELAREHHSGEGLVFD